jgi:NAD(P)H-flavin reductase
MFAWRYWTSWAAAWSWLPTTAPPATTAPVLDAIAPLAGPPPDAIYGCGPEPMLRAVAPAPRRLAYPAWISIERVMKCGLGVCGSCHCGDRLVCADGPVFPADEFLRACEK